MARNPERLEVFHLADALAIDIYRVTDDLPGAERYGLQAQIRRAAVSTAANIVEGSQRSGVRDRLRFLEIAAASAAETGYLVSVARRLSVLAEAPCVDIERRATHVTRALERLRQRIANDDLPQRTPRAT